MIPGSLCAGDVGRGDDEWVPRLPQVLMADEVSATEFPGRPEQKVLLASCRPDWNSRTFRCLPFLNCAELHGNGTFRKPVLQTIQVFAGCSNLLNGRREVTEAMKDVQEH